MTTLTNEQTSFNKWLNTFVDEKGLNREHVFEIKSEILGTNFMPLQVVIEHCEIASKVERAQIKDTIVMIDFRNGDVMHFFNYLAIALVRMKERE